MADTSYTDKGKINAIIALSNRLKYLLMEKYKIDLDTITSIRVDGDNDKIDVHVGEEYYRFKAKGIHDVLMKDPEKGIMVMELDPALAQGIYEIVDDFARD